MHAHSYMLWLRRILVLSPLALGASSCVHALVGDADVCKVGKESYAVGEKYQDDCNTCVCQEDGTSSCTELDCEPYDSDDAGVTVPTPIDAGVGVSCNYLGKPVLVGERIATECESCICEKSGKLNCEVGLAALGFNCPQDGGIPMCRYGKSTYPVGPFVSDDGCKCECGKQGQVDCFNCGAYDAGPGYPVDAAVPAPICKYNGSVVSGTFFSGGGCNTCTCQSSGEVYCTMNACQTDGGAGYCELNGNFYVVGAPVPSSDGCNNCTCIANQTIWCDKQMCTDGDAGPPPDPAVCEYEGATYKVGEGFVGKDKCSKCTCVKLGYVECFDACMMPRQCYLGGTNFQPEQQLTCPDGCNTCACQSNGDWSMTKQACSALPPVTACPADVSVSVFLAQLVYLEANSIAVPDSRCVNGKTRDFQLCYEEDAIVGSYSMYVYSTGAERACNGTTNERVFSLLPLQDAITAAHPGWRKATLRGNGITLGYGF